jgi:SAM-dependent methyltransferase
MSEANERNGDHLTVADRIGMLLKTLGVRAAHIGTSAPMELASFISGNPDVISSLTLLNASRFPLDALSVLSSRMIVFAGDKGLAGEATRHAKASFSEAEVVEFTNYPAMVWTDMAADHADRIADSMLEFLTRQNSSRPATKLSGAERLGEAAGISFQVTGEGPAVLLFPAMLAPSQWTPLVDRLAQEFAVVRLGGPHLGAVAIFEARGSDPTYRRIVRGILHDARVGPSDRLLELGCGSGVTSRWLIREGLCASPVTALDLNPFLLNEARMLTEKEEIGDAVEFHPGDAENLPFPEGTFDIVLSVTLIEECDADRAISEMVRVVKPGGRIAVVVRACDMPVFWNLPLDPEIKSKAQAPIVQVAPSGCADASLIGRFHGAGLEEVVTYPSFYGGKAMEVYYEPMALSQLDEKEKEAWNAAKATALADGTFYMMHPVHCASGIKPQ